MAIVDDMGSATMLGAPRSPSARQRQHQRAAKQIFQPIGENYRLPKAEKERLELAATIGTDGDQLLAAIDAAVEQPWLAQLPAIHVLREVWTAQYIKEDGQLRWRTAQERPATAEQISSPYDPEARYGKKRDISWTGYKAHLTETCDPETPHVITNVETSLATTPDDHMLPVVHQSLAKTELSPSEHLVDMGYTGCRMLVDSQQRPVIVIVGPVVEDTSWQAHAAEGFSKADFHVDWDQQVVTCPEGKQSISWLPSTYPKSGMQFEARFARNDCAACPGRSRCTRSKVEPRIITLQAREDFDALQSARRNQTTEAFRKSYAARAGIEGTHAQAIRRCGLRRCRYIGLAKTRLQHVITAVAVTWSELLSGTTTLLQQIPASRSLQLYRWWLDRGRRLNSPPVSLMVSPHGRAEKTFAKNASPLPGAVYFQPGR